jgi:hypothetical protein
VSGARALGGPPSLLSGETSRRIRPDGGRGRSTDVRDRAVEVSAGHGSAARVGCSASVSAAVHGSLSKKR